MTIVTVFIRGRMCFPLTTTRRWIETTHPPTPSIPPFTVAGP
jgi:hypothetical protein